MLAALRHGQSLQDLVTSLGSLLPAAEVARVVDAFALLAYADPFASPVAHALAPRARRELAAFANDSILGSPTFCLFFFVVVRLF